MLIILIWLGLGLIGAGFCNAYFKNEYPSLDSPRERRVNLLFALTLAIGGPINLAVVFCFSSFGKHGWDLTLGPPHTKSKWDK